MNFIQKRPLLTLIGTLIIGFAIGLFGFGWGLTPLEYTGAGPQDMLPTYQEAYLRNLADLYAFDGNQQRVRDSLAVWPDASGTICRMAQETSDPADTSRLQALALLNDGVGCNAGIAAGEATAATPAADAAESSGGGLSNLLLICGLGLLLALILGAIVMVMRRQRESGGADGGMGFADIPDSTPTMDSMGDEKVVTTPVARFRTTYRHGHDSYDDSFSIENASGEFLGECGVGISESIGVDSPKSVTAFEVWLFDKNDIRTVTKVIMSDHAFFDDALKAKLAPKGEPIMARDGETVVLETASLIINANINDIAYGDNPNLPEKSHFDSFTVELSAWAKEGDFDSPDIQGRVDELLNY